MNAALDTNPGALSGPGDDLSALAWVQGELRKSLDAANKSLRRYLKDTEALGGSDVDAVDPAVLRNARAQIHQGVGALELVGLPGPARLLRACEAAVQRLASRPTLMNLAAVDAVEQASFALLDYLGRLLAGKQLSPVALFPQYRAVQELAGADRVHPADLWPQDFVWQELPAEAAVVPRPADDQTRSAMEALVLAWTPPPARRAWRCCGNWPRRSSRPSRKACSPTTCTASAWLRACWPNCAAPSRARKTCPSVWRRTCCSSAPTPATLRAAAPRARACWLFAKLGACRPWPRLRSITTRRAWAVSTPPGSPKPANAWPAPKTPGRP